MRIDNGKLFAMTKPRAYQRLEPSAGLEFIEPAPESVPICNTHTRAAYYRAIEQFSGMGRARRVSASGRYRAHHGCRVHRNAATPGGAAHGQTPHGSHPDDVFLAYRKRRARLGAVVNLKVEDYYPSGKRFLLRFKEKGGKEKELPVHHKLEELLDQYLKASGLEKEPQSPLFPAAVGKTGKLSRRPLVRTDAADMLKRRLKQAGLPAHYSPHSFRATGITNFLENDGTLEAAQRIAGHADSRTTKLYDRRGQKVLLEDMERIRY